MLSARWTNLVHTFINKASKGASQALYSLFGKGPQGMVGRPLHSLRVDVVELAPRSWPPSLVTLSFWICTRGSPHEGGNRAVLSGRGQRQPAEDCRHGHNVDDRLGAWLVQLLRARDPRLAPPGRLPAGAQGIFCVQSGTPGAC